MPVRTKCGHHYVKRKVYVPMWQRLLNRLLRQRF